MLCLECNSECYKERKRLHKEIFQVFQQTQFSNCLAVHAVFLLTLCGFNCNRFGYIYTCCVLYAEAELQMHLYRGPA